MLSHAVQEGRRSGFGGPPREPGLGLPARGCAQGCPHREVAGHGAMVTLGNISPQADGTVHVPASIHVADLAATGLTYVLQKVDGVWVVKGNTGVQWVS